MGKIVIDRRAGLSRKEFFREYVIPNRPVILADAGKDWDAFNEFTPEFFEETYPEKTATINGEKYKLKDYLQLIRESTVDDPAPYPFKVDIEKKFTEVLPYVEPGFEILRKNRLKSPFFGDRLIPMAATLEIFFGGPGGWFPYIHYDLYGLYAIVTQVYGSKDFTLWAPDQARFLYISEDDPWVSSVEKYYDPDYEKYPLFRHAESSTVTVNPGETIFVPLGYWHTARSKETTISIAQDLLTAQNWHVLRRDAVFYKRKTSSFKAALLDLYIRTIGMTMNIHERFIRAY